MVHVVECQFKLNEMKIFKSSSSSISFKNVKCEKLKEQWWRGWKGESWPYATFKYSLTYSRTRRQWMILMGRKGHVAKAFAWKKPFV
jgi:hypothetical protein